VVPVLGKMGERMALYDPGRSRRRGKFLPLFAGRLESHLCLGNRRAVVAADVPEKSRFSQIWGCGTTGRLAESRFGVLVKWHCQQGKLAFTLLAELPKCRDREVAGREPSVKRFPDVLAPNGRAHLER